MLHKIANLCKQALCVSGLVSWARPAPDLSRIYRRTALKEIRNPVIVLHGILGAQLRQRSTGKIVWGAFTPDGIDPRTPEGARAVSLPMAIPDSAFAHDPEREDVFASEPLTALQLSILHRVHAVKVYAQIIRSLGAGGFRDRIVVDRNSPRYADDHYSCFTFFYDWRRDNVENAIRLGRFLSHKREEIAVNAPAKIQRLRRQGGDARLARARQIERWLEEGYRFDIVAHSMGGLIARYYLRYGATDLPAGGEAPQLTWAGADEVDRLVLVGTPNFGSMESLRNLLEGFRPARVLPHFHAVVLDTMASIYQLLPRNRHRLFVDAEGRPVDLDLFDVAAWEERRWGMFAPGADRLLQVLLPDVSGADGRRERARQYVGWCLQRARDLHAALDRNAGSACPTRLCLFAGDAQPTLARARLLPGGAVDFAHPSLWTDGDGTVTRYSAVADERLGEQREPWLASPVAWDQVTFLADDHIGLTRNPQFTDNLLFLLLEQAPQRR